MVRALLDAKTRQRILDETRDSGAPDCAWCGADILERRPSKRYCSDLCRKRGGFRDRRPLRFRGLAA